MKAFFFYLNYWRGYFFACLTFLGGLVGGYWSFLGLGIIFVLHPLMDNLIQRNINIPPFRLRSKWSVAPLVFALPFLCLFSFGGLLLAMQANQLEMLGLVLSFGTILGVLGINTAHELVHRREGWLRNLGMGILTLVNFTHWETEHVYGHHKKVATPDDSATARKNEWIYIYYFRSYFGGLMSSIRIENQRLKNKKSFNPWQNRIYWFGLLQLLITIFVYVISGSAGLLFWIGQSLMAIFLLQTVDYIEHYGLLRQKNEMGVYEPVKTNHSWDSYKAWTNYTLFNLGFHSHHHHKAALPYTELQAQPTAMHLPLGYSAMALLALVPPLFFMLMNPKLKKIDGTQN